MNPLEYEEPGRAIATLIRNWLRDLSEDDFGGKPEIEKRNDGNTTIVYRKRNGQIKAQYTIVVWENVAS